MVYMCIYIYGYYMVNDNKNLVGGWATPVKNMKISWDDYSQYIEK